MKENETVAVNYEAMYEEESERRKYELKEQEKQFKNELDREKTEKSLIIENQLKEIEFLKNIIKGILHF